MCGPDEERSGLTEVNGRFTASPRQSARSSKERRRRRERTKGAARVAAADRTARGSGMASWLRVRIDHDAASLAWSRLSELAVAHRLSVVSRFRRLDSSQSSFPLPRHTIVSGGAQLGPEPPLTRHCQRIHRNLACLKVGAKPEPLDEQGLQHLDRRNVKRR